MNSEILKSIEEGKVVLGISVSRERAIEIMQMFVANPQLNKIFVPSDIIVLPNGENGSNSDNQDLKS